MPIIIMLVVFTCLLFGVLFSTGIFLSFFAFFDCVAIGVTTLLLSSKYISPHIMAEDYQFIMNFALAAIAVYIYFSFLKKLSRKNETVFKIFNIAVSTLGMSFLFFLFDFKSIEMFKSPVANKLGYMAIVLIVGILGGIFKTNKMYNHMFITKIRKQTRRFIHEDAKEDQNFYDENRIYIDEDNDNEYTDYIEIKTNDEI